MVLVGQVEQHLYVNTRMAGAVDSHANLVKIHVTLASFPCRVGTWPGNKARYMYAKPFQSKTSLPRGGGVKKALYQ